jgi:CheY-like chemotaxis protein
MQKLKEILIIDDDTISQLIIRVVIHKMDITERIIIKSDGFQALAFLKEKCSPDGKLAAEQCPDLILLDINMPVINGFNFLEALKDMNWQAVIRSKVIMLSSSTDEQDYKKAAAYGVRGFIVKPLTKEKLLSFLRQDAIS